MLEGGGRRSGLIKANGGLPAGRTRPILYVLHRFVPQQPTNVMAANRTAPVHTWTCAPFVPFQRYAEDGRTHAGALAPMQTNAGSTGGCDVVATVCVKIRVVLLHVGMCAHTKEHRHQICVEVINRAHPRARRAVDVYDLCDALDPALGADATTEVVVHADVSVRAPLASDAMVSVSYTTARPGASCSEHSLLRAAEGDGVYVGRAVFLVKDLARVGPDELHGNVFPVGTQVCCEDVVHDGEEPRATIYASVVRGSFDAALRVPWERPPAYLDAVQDARRIAELTRKIEGDNVARRERLGAARGCPSTVECFFRAISDLCIFPGFLFNGTRVLGASSSAWDAMDALVVAALVWREAEEDTLLSAARAEGDARAVRLLEGNPAAVDKGTLLDMELARIRRVAQGDEVAEANELVELVCRAVQTTMMGNVYVGDTQTVLRRAAKGRRLVASTEDTDNYRAAGVGHSGDCEDEQHPLMELFTEVAAVGARIADGNFAGTGHHALVRAAAVSAAAYVALSCIGMAWASHPGADGAHELQGHMFCLVLPKAFVVGGRCVPPRAGGHPHQRHFVLEGTTLMDVRHRPRPNQRAMDAFVRGVGAEALDTLGINTSSTTQYATDDKFYSTVAASAGPCLHETTVDVPGRGPMHVFDCMPTHPGAPDGRKGGVKFETMMDPAALERHGVRMEATGFVAPDDLHSLFSLLEVLPGSLPAEMVQSADAAVTADPAKVDCHWAAEALRRLNRAEHVRRGPSDAFPILVPAALVTEPYLAFLEKVIATTRCIVGTCAFVLTARAEVPVLAIVLRIRVG